MTQALKKALQEGCATGDVGKMNTSTVRTRLLEETLINILNPTQGNGMYGNGPQCASAVVLVQWSQTILSMRRALVDDDMNGLESILEKAGENNRVGPMFRARGIRKEAKLHINIHDTEVSQLHSTSNLSSSLTTTGVRKKRCRSNIAVIIVKVIFISAFLFYCLLLNHSFPTKPNRITM
jgi:hypothetical protein